jgi:hypothetical protein
MFPGVENIAQTIPGSLNVGTQNGAIITASGLKAIYLRNTYCTWRSAVPTPGEGNPLEDVLLWIS